MTPHLLPAPGRHPRTRSIRAIGLAAALAFLASSAGAGSGGEGSAQILSVDSEAETEAGSNVIQRVGNFGMDDYDHELEVFTPGSEGESESRELAKQRSRITSSPGGLTLTSAAEADLDAPQGFGNAKTTFALSFEADGPVSVSFSAQIQVEAPGNGGSSAAAVSFSCGCDPEESGEECTVPDRDLEVGDESGVPRSGSVSASGIADGFCSLFLFIGTTLGEDQTRARATWQATLNVSTGTAPEQGTRFRWVGPAQGSFGDEDNWRDENGAAGVPGFRSFEDADSSLVQNAGNLTLDLAGGLSRTLAARGIARRTGRLAVRGTQLVKPVGGTLILDSLEPGIAERSLQIGGARLLLDLGGILARHVVVGQNGKGELEVVGPNGFFTTLGRFGIGGSSNGNVLFRSGATVTSAETVLGELEGAGSAVAEGAGTFWRTGNLAVGLADDAALTVRGGARVESENAFVDCQLAGGPGVPGCEGLSGQEKARVEVSGASSTWALSGDLSIGGRGKVDVQGGAAIEVSIVQVGTSGNDANCLLGTACLSVADGSVVASGGIKVGDGGHGRLEIGPAGRVSGAFGVLAGARGLSDGEIVVRGPSAEPQLVTEETGLGLGVAFDARGILALENGARASIRGGSHVGPSGRIEVSDGSVLEIVGIDANLEVGHDAAGGEQEPNGEIVLSNGLVTFVGGEGELGSGDLRVRRTGRVTGVGRISTLGIVENDGFVGCGVSISGLYLQGATGVLECPQANPPPAPQLNPLAASSLVRSLRKKQAPPPPPPRGPFVVEGDATLGGTLALSFLNGFAPRQGDSFVILDVSGEIDGAFDDVAVTGLAAGSFDFASDLVGGRLTLTSLTDAVGLPPVTLKAKKKLKEKKKKGLKVKLRRGGDLSEPLTVHYRVAGTARNGSDYARLPGTIEIPARKRTAKLVLRPFADAITEGTETIEIELLPGEGYSLPLAPRVSIELRDPKPKKRR